MCCHRRVRGGDGLARTRLALVIALNVAVAVTAIGLRWMERKLWNLR
jgi:hypothetical protein